MADNRTRVLFLIESLAGGGAEKVLTVLLRHFNYEKYEVTVCPIVDTGVYRDEVKKYASNYHALVSYQGNFLSRLWNRIKYKLVYSVLPLKWVYKWFIPQGNTVEIAFCEGYVTKLLAHANSKSKKIAWIHTDLRDNPWPREIGVFKNLAEEIEAYSSYDNIVCVSDQVRCSFNDVYGLSKKTCTILNPIDVVDIQDKAETVSTKAIDYFHIISIGRLVTQKGYDRLLKVVERLHGDYDSLRLTIVGEGEERENLEKYISDHQMYSYVSLPGFMENPYSELSASDLFVCSSIAEGYSLVVAEALVLGIPVISTDCSGPNELLGDGEYGLLVENSEEGLYQGIKSVLSDTSLLKELKTKSQIRGMMFGVKETIKQVEELLD